jgi:hypothetical protein
MKSSEAEWLQACDMCRPNCQSKIPDEIHWAGQLNFTCAIFSEFGNWAQVTYWTNPSIVHRLGR